MSGYDTRFQRLELKYLVDERTAERIREDLAPYCDPDPHNGDGDRLGYEIHSLYLDTPALAFHNAKERGDPERVKLRVRTYSRAPIALLEVKRKVSDVVHKTRVVVDRDEAERAARGLGRPLVEDPAAQRYLDRFARLAAESGAEPKLHIRYDREAYVSGVDHYARVTFDRNISAQRTERWSLSPDPNGWIQFDRHWSADLSGRTTVLELKCTSSVPYWLSDLIRAHGLQRISFSKYSIGINLTARYMGSNQLMRRSARVMA